MYVQAFNPKNGVGFPAWGKCKGFWPRPQLFEIRI